MIDKVQQQYEQMQASGQWRLQGRCLSEFPCLNFQSPLHGLAELAAFEDGVVLSEFKERLDFLNGLSPEQFSYLENPEAGLESLLDPALGYPLEDYKDLIGWYAPLTSAEDVPTPPEIGLRFHVVAQEETWAALIVADWAVFEQWFDPDDRMLEGKWDLETGERAVRAQTAPDLPRDALNTPGKLQLRYVTDRGRELIGLPDYSDADAGIYEQDFYKTAYMTRYIPPVPGRIYWRFTDWVVASASSVTVDSPWVGGIRLTQGIHPADVTRYVPDKRSRPYIPITRCGKLSWTPPDSQSVEEPPG